MKYQVAERFKSIQGEGVYAGTPMAFIRFVGCSVGKKICQHCDTDFEKMYDHLEGGEYSVSELIEWVGNYRHICFTGGEPLDQDLRPFFYNYTRHYHIETSGTVRPDWLPPLKDTIAPPIHVCVSPKPGWRDDMIDRADEIKVIIPGLGNGEGWPTKEHARHWAHRGKIVFIQPRNAKFEIDANNTRICEELVNRYPELRLSVQLHKILKVR